MALILSRGESLEAMLLGTIFRSHKKRKPSAGCVYEEIAWDGGNDHPLYWLSGRKATDEHESHLHGM
jgi:hypothetical protein